MTTPVQAISNIAVISILFSFAGKWSAVVSLYLHASTLKLFYYSFK
jgi:hypothetical protein